jgi:hypothetical protein
MRQYIRHPTDIPIEVRSTQVDNNVEARSRNVSVGGLAFSSRLPLTPESIINLRIDSVSPPFETRARVIWCRSGGDGAKEGAYDVGVSFLDASDAFTARMVEQVCHIESYRKHVAEAEHRALSSQEAAQEWITRFAAAFSRPEDSH